MFERLSVSNVVVWLCRKNYFCSLMICLKFNLTFTAKLIVFTIVLLRFIILQASMQTNCLCLKHTFTLALFRYVVLLCMCAVTVRGGAKNFYAMGNVTKSKFRNRRLQLVNLLWLSNIQTRGRCKWFESIAATKIIFHMYIYKTLCSSKIYNIT